MSHVAWLSELCISEVNLVNRYNAAKTEYPMKNAGRRHHGFLYTLEGTEVYHFHDQIVYAVPGSVTYIPKGEKYTIDLIGERSIVTAFDFEGIEATPSRPFCIKAENDAALREHFISAERKWYSKKTESVAECKASFYKMIAGLIKNETHYSNNKHRERLAPAISYLHSHFLESDFKISQLSEIAEISPRYFEQLFFNEFKTTPKEYVISLKLELAKELLLSEKSSVSSVAEQLGYSDLYHFSKLFKKKTGYAPGQYKRMNSP